MNTRLVSAARGNLRDRIDDGSFRLDLFFRINAVTIDLPPLRQRIVDLPMLIEYFFEIHSKALRQTPKPLSREMMRMMEHHSWPGNIRELENMVRNYVLIGSEDVLVSEMVPGAPARLTTEIDQRTRLAQRHYRCGHAVSGARDYSPRSAGQRLESLEDRQVAEDELSLPALQAAGIPNRIVNGQICRPEPRSPVHDRTNRIDEFPFKAIGADGRTKSSTLLH